MKGWSAAMGMRMQSEACSRSSSESPVFSFPNRMATCCPRALASSHASGRLTRGQDAGDTASGGRREHAVHAGQRLGQGLGAGRALENVPGFDCHLVGHLVLRHREASRFHEGEPREAHGLDGARGGPDVLRIVRAHQHEARRSVYRQL